MIPELNALVGKQVKFMLEGSGLSWFGPYELMGVEWDDVSMTGGVTVRGSQDYVINLDRVVVFTEG